MAGYRKQELKYLNTVRWGTANLSMFPTAGDIIQTDTLDGYNFDMIMLIWCRVKVTHFGLSHGYN